MSGKLRVLDLFSGIGGFSLGLERTGGFETVAFCEIEPYCRKVLTKHWPDVRCYDDVRTLTAARLAADGIAAPLGDSDAERCGRWPDDERPVSTGRNGASPTGIDVICGGFPCQDISHAGKGAGIDGERSGLWSEYARLIGELRPRYVIVENVAALLGRGLARVLGDLAAIGYDAEWHCIPASAVGAPHRRDRLWIVANPAWLQSGRSQQRPEWQRTGPGSEPIAVADAGCELWGTGRAESSTDQSLSDVYNQRCNQDVADAERWRWHSWNEQPSAPSPDVAAANGGALADAESGGRAERDSHGRRSSQGNGAHEWAGPAGGGWWLAEPDVGRVAHGVPQRVDRLRALGNAVVPQIPELIGRAILHSISTEAAD